MLTLVYPASFHEYVNVVLGIFADHEVLSFHRDRARSYYLALHVQLFQGHVMGYHVRYYAVYHAAYLHGRIDGVGVIRPVVVIEVIERVKSAGLVDYLNSQSSSLDGYYLIVEGRALPLFFFKHHGPGAYQRIHLFYGIHHFLVYSFEIGRSGIQSYQLQGIFVDIIDFPVAGYVGYIHVSGKRALFLRDPGPPAQHDPVVLDGDDVDPLFGVGADDLYLCLFCGIVEVTRYAGFRRVRYLLLADIERFEDVTSAEVYYPEMPAVHVDDPVGKVSLHPIRRILGVSEVPVFPCSLYVQEVDYLPDAVHVPVRDRAAPVDVGVATRVGYLQERRYVVGVDHSVPAVETLVQEVVICRDVGDTAVLHIDLYGAVLDEKHEVHHRVGVGFVENAVEIEIQDGHVLFDFLLVLGIRRIVGPHFRIQFYVVRLELVPGRVLLCDFNLDQRPAALYGPVLVHVRFVQLYQVPDAELVVLFQAELGVIVYPQPVPEVVFVDHGVVVHVKAVVYHRLKKVQVETVDHPVPVDIGPLQLVAGNGAYFHNVADKLFHVVKLVLAHQPVAVPVELLELEDARKGPEQLFLRYRFVAIDVHLLEREELEQSVVQVELLVLREIGPRVIRRARRDYAELVDHFPQYRFLGRFGRGPGEYLVLQDALYGLYLHVERTGHVSFKRMEPQVIDGAFHRPDIFSCQGPSLVEFVQERIDPRQFGIDLFRLDYLFLVADDEVYVVFTYHPVAVHVDRVLHHKLEIGYVVPRESAVHVKIRHDQVSERRELAERYVPYGLLDVEQVRVIYETVP